MDNNNQPAQVPNPVPNTQPQPVPPVATPTPAVTSTPQQPSSSNKMIIIILILVVLVLVAGGVAYWFLGKQKAQNTEAPTPQATTTPVSTETLDQELSSIDVQNPDSEFTIVDTDLQNL